MLTQTLVRESSAVYHIVYRVTCGFFFLNNREREYSDSDAQYQKDRKAAEHSPCPFQKSAFRYLFILVPPGKVSVVGGQLRAAVILSCRFTILYGLQRSFASCNKRIHLCQSSTPKLKLPTPTNRGSRLGSPRNPPEMEAAIVSQLATTRRAPLGEAPLENELLFLLSSETYSPCRILLLLFDLGEHFLPSLVGSSRRLLVVRALPNFPVARYASPRLS